MSQKQVKPFGSWDFSLPTSFVTSGEFKGFPELQLTQDGTVYLLKQLSSNGSRVLFRKTLGSSDFERVPVEDKIKNGVNAYGALSVFARSKDEFVYTSPSKITWVRHGEKRSFQAEKKELGDLNIYKDHVYALVEDKNVRPSTQSIARFDFNNPEDELTIAEGYDFYASPRVSPDGQYLLYTGWNDPNMPWDATTVHLVDLNKNPKTSIRVLPHDEKALTNYQAIQWAPDSKSFYFISDHEDSWIIYNYNIENNFIHRVASVHGADLGDAIWQIGDDKFYAVNENYVIYSANEVLFKKNVKTEEVSSIEIPGFNTFNKIFIDSNDNVVCLAQGPVKGDTVLHITQDNHLHILDQAYDSTVLEEYGFGEYKLLNYDVFDEKTGEKFVISGYFYSPVNPHFEGPPDEKPPVILMAHGGPTAQTKPTFDKKKAFYQSKGFAIFDINYRGSTGKGRYFRDALYGKFGQADVQDVCDSIKFLSEGGPALEFINPDKVFITGGSAGGYLLLRALARNPEAFRAGACSYGFCDIYALCSEDHKFEYAYNYALISPKEDSKTWEERNMTDKLDRIKTPLMLFHGKEDPVVPYAQSISIYEALKKNNIPTGLELFEGEGHGFRSKPVIEKVLDTTYNFFCEALGVTPGKSEALPPGKSIKLPNQAVRLALKAVAKI
ncbi:unnamed protein product [Bursaphelenchus xylophilus]|nr:unnamed protein product [Bursaphelenchus xylophilus]CAG9109454.1 unnamed protein product [Bursaphelenchus xylophilus]